MTTTDDVIRLAAEAGIISTALAFSKPGLSIRWKTSEVARLIALAKAEEREACAQTAMLTASNGIETSAAIRARSKEQA